ncbi:MAG: histone deacetylase [Candidatus Kapabacteria bacterium]|nr:histone deacetylase [Candidatus Kapabacteria bacterium]MDW8011644.1 histone deacetylase [Bacteroidota bacterium]
MRVFYSDHYTIPLPPGHRFPMSKYRMVRHALEAQDVLPGSCFCEAPLASPEDLLRAHIPEYVQAFLSGTIPPNIMRRIGFPWSQELVLRTLATVGGALAAAEAALQEGISGNLAGGTHHAMPDSGEGFCVFNDLAIVALSLLQRRKVRRIAIIDLDVHQGNGTAAILSAYPEIFTFSMHGARNYPYRKVPSTLDVPLEDHTDDDTYLRLLESLLPRIIAFKPDIVLYQAGVDPLREDTLGRLDLSHLGLMERDFLVLSMCLRHEIPIVLTLGGGYADPIELSVQAYVNTYRVATELFSRLA